MNRREDSGWDFRRSFDLLYQLAAREISESFKGSILGFAWLILGPLMSMALYVIVFGVLFGGSFGKVEHESSISYAIGVYIGLSITNLVNDTITKSTSCLFRHSTLIKKVAFPVYLLSVSQMLEIGFRLLVNSLLWLAMAIWFGSALTPGILFLPVIFLPLLMLGLGLTYLISSLSVYFRDIQQLTSIVTQIIFWSSGVFYSTIRVMEFPQLWSFLKWNPVLLAIECIRDVTLWNLPPNLNHILYLYVFSFFTLALGIYIFHRLQPGFSDFL